LFPIFFDAKAAAIDLAAMSKSRSQLRAYRPKADQISTSPASLLELHTKAEGDRMRLLVARRLAAALGRQAAAEAWAAATGLGPDGDQRQ
jgi:hypothetical protein